MMISSRFLVPFSLLLFLSGCDSDPSAVGTPDIALDTSVSDVPVVPDVAVDSTAQIDQTTGTDGAVDDAETSTDTSVALGLEHCVNGVDDNGDDLVDCADPLCGTAPNCVSEICDNGIDDDGDRRVDCADVECKVQDLCLTEICTNGFDDDRDALVDCADDDCVGEPGCLGAEVCDNGIDDDGDFKIDCIDPDCGADPMCVDSINSQFCTAVGQQCRTSVGDKQGPFLCLAPEDSPQVRACFALCLEEDPTTCPTGFYCFDETPSDFYGPVCRPTQCTTPLTGDTCPTSSQCIPGPRGFGLCLATGAGAAGAPCTDFPDCAEGLTCQAGECRPGCEIANPACAVSGESCLPVYSDLGLGLCEEGCDALSENQCGDGEACRNVAPDIWACRSAPETVPPTCESGDECPEGYVCSLGECARLCLEHAQTQCEGEPCAILDDTARWGVCGEPCDHRVVETCSDPIEKCVWYTDAGICRPSAGAGLGEPCTEYLDCGSGLICVGDVCERQCLPFDADVDTCPDEQACFGWSSTLGWCKDLTSYGRASGEQCSPHAGVCDDATYCWGTSSFCYQECRNALTGPDGTNPDCGFGLVCERGYGWQDLGLCIPG